MTKNTEKKITTIQELVEFGKKQGKLTSIDINKFLEEVSFDLEQVEKLYETIDTNNIDILDIVEEEEEEADKWWEDPDFWLMLSSISLAVVLLIVMIAMFISRIIVNARKAKANKQSNRYDATRKRYIKRLNLQTEEEEATADETVPAESNEAQENESENPNE